MKKNGFTLIEILVVIAILAGLVAILFPNFMDVRQRARDAQRKSDLRQLQKALEYYKEDQFPPTYPADGGLPSPCGVWQSASGHVYMAKVPGDPSGTCTSHFEYYYKCTDPGYASTGKCLEYVLYACLENKDDPEGVICTPQAPYFNSYVTDYTCGTNICYKVTQP